MTYPTYNDLTQAVQQDMLHTIAEDKSPMTQIVKQYGFQGAGSNRIQDPALQQTYPTGTSLPFLGKTKVPTQIRAYSAIPGQTLSEALQDKRVKLMYYNAQTHKLYRTVQSYTAPKDIPLPDGANHQSALITTLNYNDKKQRIQTGIELNDVISGNHLLARSDTYNAQGKNEVALYQGNDRTPMTLEAMILNNATWKDKEPTQLQLNYLKWFGDPRTEEELKTQTRGQLSDDINTAETALDFTKKNRGFAIRDTLAFSQYAHKNAEGIPDRFPKIHTLNDALDQIEENRKTNDYKLHPDDPEYNIAGISETELKAVLSSALHSNEQDWQENLQAIQSGEKHLPHTYSLQVGESAVPHYLQALNSLNQAQKQPVDFSQTTWKEVRAQYLDILNPLMEAAGFPKLKNGELATAYKKQQKQLAAQQIQAAQQDLQRTEITPQQTKSQAFRG